MPPAQRLASQQRGVALISVLLVFSLIVILLGGRVVRDGLDIRRSDFHLKHAQAMQYALGGEELARQLLHADWLDDKQKQTDTDHQQENWYRLSDFEPGRGRMRVTIRDLHGRYNLNNLLAGGGQVDNRQVAAFQRLLQALNLPTETLPALLDWLDSDADPLTSHSEDAWYLAREPAYRSADAALVDSSELRAIGLFSEEELQRLLPHVTSLPGLTTINPNTATATVLTALQQGLQAEQVVNQRANKPFMSDSEFLQSDATAGLDINTTDISVRSRYFEVLVNVELDGVILDLRSVLHRDPESGTITGEMRSLLKPAGTTAPHLAQSTPDSG